MQSKTFHDATKDVVVCGTCSCILLNLLTCPFCSAEADKRREQKEAQRLKEEQRYEQWAAERGLSDAGEGPADGPKKRMTRLQKVSLG